MATNLASGITRKAPRDSQGVWSKKGMAFNYSSNVMVPDDLGTVKLTNPFTLVTTVRDNADYAIGALLKGTDCRNNNLTLGNRFFVPSGTCDDVKSAPVCRNKTRYIFVDNVPSRVMPCVDTTQSYDPKCDKGGTGLMQGLIQDVVKINPFEMIYSAVGEGSVVNDQCVPRTEYVGYVKGGVGKCVGTGADCNSISTPKECNRAPRCQWQAINWTKNMRRETRCAPAPRPLVCSLQFKGTECKVYSLDNLASRFIANNNAISTAGDALINPFPLETVGSAAVMNVHYSNANSNSELYDTLVEHVRNSANTIREENQNILATRRTPPHRLLAWAVVAQTKERVYIYALRRVDEQEDKYVSDVGVKMQVIRPTSQQRRSFAAFNRLFRNLASCTNAAQCTQISNDLRKFCVAVDLRRMPVGTTYVEHSNASMNTLLGELVVDNPLPSDITKEPEVEKQLTVSPYGVWRDMITNINENGVHDKFIKKYKDSYQISDEHILKTACLKEHAACKDNYEKFVWIGTVYRSRRMYGFQIEWTMYRNKVRNPGQTYLTRAVVVGNPQAIDIPNKVSPRERWVATEGFLGSSRSSLSSHTSAAARLMRPARGGACCSCYALAAAVIVALALVGGALLLAHRRRNAVVCASAASAALSIAVVTAIAVAISVSACRPYLARDAASPDLAT